MNKAELIEIAAKEADISKAAAGKALDGIMAAVVKAVSKGDNVTLVGFGTFKSAKRAARTGKNPKTGATLKIAATTVPKFTAGTAFKAAVAYGLANCIEPTTGGGLQTKWHVGGIDKTGEFLEVVRMFHEFGENDRPWDYIRRVGDASLKAIGPRIEYADVPSELFVD